MNNKVRMKIFTHGTRLINRLVMEGIDFSDVITASDSITLSVNKGDMEPTLEIMKNLDSSYIVVKNTVLNSLSHVLLDRLGIVVGIIILCMLVVLTKFLTLDIEINGNNRISDRAILESLTALDVRENAMRVRDTKTLSRTLISMHPDIASCTCYYEGAKLIIDIAEEVQQSPYYKDAGGNIIANFDGIITRVIVESGTANVKVGDTVRRGDILIEPYVKYGEGEEEKTRETIARGKVFARCYLEENIVLGEKNLIEVETGKTKTVNRYWGLPKSPYSHSQVYSKKKRLYSLLPIEYTSYTYKEIVLKCASIEDKEFLNSHIMRAYNKLNERVFEGEKVLGKWIFQKRLDNTYIISVYYEVEKLISGGELE